MCADTCMSGAVCVVRSYMYVHAVHVVRAEIGAVRADIRFGTVECGYRPMVHPHAGGVRGAFYSLRVATRDYKRDALPKSALGLRGWHGARRAAGRRPRSVSRRVAARCQQDLLEVYMYIIIQP